MDEERPTPQAQKELVWLVRYHKEAKRLQDLMRIPGIDALARSPGLMSAIQAAEAAAKPFVGMQAIIGRTKGLMPTIGATQADALLRIGDVGRHVAKGMAIDAVFDFQKLGRVLADGVAPGKILAEFKVHQSAFESLHAVRKDLFLSTFLANRPWKELRDSIRTASSALADDSVQAAVRRALEASEEQAADGDESAEIGLQSFMARLQGLDLQTKVSVYGVLLAMFMFLMNPLYDTLFKDVFFKASQEEDRRALAREIAKEVSKIDPFATYAASRRVVMKALVAHQNPKALSPRIGQVRMGEVVELVSSDKDWAQIMWQDGTGRQLSGWVFTRYLKPLK